MKKLIENVMNRIGLDINRTRDKVIMIVIFVGMLWLVWNLIAEFGKCRYKGCEEKVYKSGYCKYHYTMELWDANN